jgi:spermidine/putrescine-binding protein
LRTFGRRRFLRLAAGTAAALAMPGARAGAAAPTGGIGIPGASPSPIPAPPGELRLLTSPDHWDPGVIRTLGAQDGIEVRVDPLWDDAEAHRTVLAGEAAADLVTADGGWVTRYRSDDLIEPLDPDRLTVTRELYPMALELELLTSEDGTLLGFPWSWSPLQVVCDPARLTAVPIRGMCSSTRGTVVGWSSTRNGSTWCCARLGPSAPPTRWR